MFYACVVFLISVIIRVIFYLKIKEKLNFNGSSFLVLVSDILFYILLYEWIGSARGIGVPTVTSMISSTMGIEIHRAYIISGIFLILIISALYFLFVINFKAEEKYNFVDELTIKKLKIILSKSYVLIIIGLALFVYIVPFLISYYQNDIQVGSGYLQTNAGYVTSPLFLMWTYMFLIRLPIGNLISKKILNHHESDRTEHTT